MALSVVITQITPTNEIRRGGCINVHAAASTLGTGRQDQHEFHWEVTAYPVGYTYVVQEPDYCDSDKPEVGPFAGASVDILDGGAYGISFGIPDVIPGDYTFRCTGKDGGIPHTQDFDEITVTVLAPEACTPAETLVELRADGAGDFTTLEAVIAAHFNTENLRIEISQAGTYAEASTNHRASGLQLVCTVAGVVIDGNVCPVVGHSSMTTLENWSFSDFDMINSAGPGEAIAGLHSLGSGYTKRNFSMVDVTASGANIGGLFNSTFGPNTSALICRSFNNATLANYGIGFWGGGMTGNDTMLCVIGCRSDVILGERGFRTGSSNVALHLSRIEGESDTGANVNKESVRFWSSNCSKCTVDRCALPGGMIVGLDTGQGLASNIRTTNIYGIRKRYAAAEATSGAIGYNNCDGSTTVACFMDTEDDNGGLFVAGDNGCDMLMCTLYNRRLTKAGLASNSAALLGVFKFHGNVMTQDDPDREITGFSSSRNVISQSASTLFQSVDNDTVPSGSEGGADTVTSNNGYQIDGAYKSQSAWTADPNTSGDVFVTRSVDVGTFEVAGVGSTTVPAGCFRDFYGNVLTPGDAALRGAVQSVPPAPSMASTTVSVNADGTVEVVAIIDGAWVVPQGLDAPVLTLLVDGARTITVDTGNISVSVTTTNTIADTATASFTTDGPIYAGEAVEIILCEAGIIDDTISQSIAVDPATAVVNNSTVPNLSPDLAFEFDAAPVADGATVNLGVELSIDSIASLTITIENAGTGPAAIGTITAGGDASIDGGDNPSNTSLAAAASTTVTVSLDTSSIGVIIGTISIPSDDASSPFDLTITGTVVAPSLEISDLSGVLASGVTIALGDDIDQDESVSVSFTIENTGTGIATIGTIESTGVVIVDGIDNPSGLTLAVDATDSLSVSIDTSVEGAIAGTLTIPSDDPASPFTLSFAGIVIAPEVIPDNNPGPSTRQAYLSVVEADGIIDEMLLGAQIMKQAWASLTTDDKLKCIANASIDIDSVRWVGIKVDEDQPTSWPRMNRNGELILPMGEPQLPTGVNTGVWSFAGLPREIRIGVAIQAAARAAQALSLDTDAETLGRAAMGITGISGSGISVSADPVAARRATSNLHWSVLKIVDKYIPRTVNFI